MDKRTYHHEDLKKELIEKTITIINREGKDALSMRKLAAECGVSHAAPYKHFKNKEKLIECCFNYVMAGLEKSMKEVEEEYKDSIDTLVIELGKKYVRFMVDNPDYLKITFLGEFFKDAVKLENNNFVSEFEAFNILKRNAIKEFKIHNIDEKYYSRDILSMWAMVHGIAVMLANRTFNYDGDIDSLVEDILRNNMRF